MTIVKWLSVISLAILVFATLIGFTDVNDPNDCMNNLKRLINSVFKWNWLNKRYILTKILLVLGFCLGVVSIVFSK